MNPPELLAALGPVLEVLRRLQVRHYVGGSIASSAHGIPRASVDADVVAELRPEHVRPLVSHLENDCYVEEARVRDPVASRRSFNAIHLETMLKVDVFVSKGRAFDDEAMRRAQPLAMGTGPLAEAMLATAEDTVLAKLEWFRAGGEVSERAMDRRAGGSEGVRGRHRRPLPGEMGGAAGGCGPPGPGIG